MTDYANIASEEAIAAAKQALEANGFAVTIVENAQAAKEAVVNALPKGAEVLTMTSQTLEKTGIAALVNESGDYDSVRGKLNAMYGDESKKGEQRKLGAAPDFAIGSVHAVTQDGHVLVASNTGSQLPAYTYGAGHVIWVVGAQKVVADLTEAQERLEKHVFPLENERSKVAYGGPSSINKVVTFYKEGTPGRIEIFLAKEALGF
ncbi:MAG TPA: LUD domain-containing protein [Patescibacteria group bacterium]|nr:LUD domain-containing protein [Patescibacteria group bacterium]